MFIRKNCTMCETLGRTRLKVLSFGHAISEKSPWGRVSGTPFSRLYLILKGSFCVKNPDGDIIELKEGGCYLIPASARFEYCCPDMVEHIYFHIKLSGREDMDLLQSCTDTVCQLGEVGWASVVYDMIQNESHNPAEGLWLKNEIYTLIVKCLENYDIHIEEKKYSQCIVRAMEYIQSHLSADIWIDDIADYSYVARSTLTKFFRNEVHMSMTDYMYELIWTEAFRLLSNTHMTIYDVSVKLGFSDQAYFSNRFNEVFHIRPGEYRKQSLI